MAKTINFTTGPVKPEQEVALAFNTSPVSHRSVGCIKIADEIREALSSTLGAKEVFLMSGSGTLANEAMIAQIAQSKENGIILSNGEFGERLINQFRHYHTNFSTIQKEWGQHFALDEIKKAISIHQPSWLLICHHETSTGVLNDLAEISKICRQNSVSLFADCISSIGNIPLDLTDVSMATGSSGKGLGAIPGLALVFSNTALTTSQSIPVYLDLAYYRQTNFLPFTISSNLLFALKKAIDITLCIKHHQKNIYLGSVLKSKLSEKGFSILNQQEESEAFVFSLPLGEKHSSQYIGEKLKENGILISYESSYLTKRNMIQLSLMGVHSLDEVELLVKKLAEICFTLEIIKQS